MASRLPAAHSPTSLCVTRTDTFWPSMSHFSDSTSCRLGRVALEVLSLKMYLEQRCSAMLRDQDSTSLAWGTPRVPIECPHLSGSHRGLCEIQGRIWAYVHCPPSRLKNKTDATRGKVRYAPVRHSRKTGFSFFRPRNIFFQATCHSSLIFLLGLRKRTFVFFLDRHLWPGKRLLCLQNFAL